MQESREGGRRPAGGNGPDGRPYGGSVPLGSVRPVTPSGRGYAEQAGRSRAAGEPAGHGNASRERSGAVAERSAAGRPYPERGAGRREEARSSLQQGSYQHRSSVASGVRRSAAAGPGPVAQAIAAVGRVIGLAARAAWGLLCAIGRGVVALLRTAVPFCAQHLRATLAVVAAIILAVAVTQVRGWAGRQQNARDAQASQAAASDVASALMAPVEAQASALVEPQSTPKNQWAAGQMPYLYQIDPQWSHESYAGGLLRHQGCGPTALDMVYIALTGKTDLDPAGMAEFATQNGYAASGQGTSWDLMTSGAAKLGLTGKQLSTSETAVRAELEAGRPVICLMNPGTFTSVGHFIVVEKLGDDGRAVVHDSNSAVRSRKTWDLALVCREAATAWSFTAE